MESKYVLLSNKASIIYFTSWFWALPLVNLFVVIGYYSYLIFFLHISQKISPILKIINFLWRKGYQNKFSQHVEILVYSITILYAMCNKHSLLVTNI